MKQETKPQDTSTPKDELTTMHVFIHKNKIVSSKTGDLIAEVYPYMEDADKIADKIANSINSTYGKGLNPAVMTEMYEALEEAKSALAIMLPSPKDSFVYNTICTALKNAKI